MKDKMKEDAYRRLRAYKMGFEEGKQQARKEFLEMIKSRKIECTMKWGEWWVKLDSLKKQLEEKK
jgi:hypothetical protein